MAMSRDGHNPGRPNRSRRHHHRQDEATDGMDTDLWDHFRVNGRLIGSINSPEIRSLLRLTGRPVRRFSFAAILEDGTSFRTTQPPDLEPEPGVQSHPDTRTNLPTAALASGGWSTMITSGGGVAYSTLRPNHDMPLNTHPTRESNNVGGTILGLGNEVLQTIADIFGASSPAPLEAARTGRRAAFAFPNNPESPTEPQDPRTSESIHDPFDDWYVSVHSEDSDSSDGEIVIDIDSDYMSDLEPLVRNVEDLPSGLSYHDAQAERMNILSQEMRDAMERFTFRDWRPPLRAPVRGSPEDMVRALATITPAQRHLLARAIAQPQYLQVHPSLIQRDPVADVATPAHNIEVNSNEVEAEDESTPLCPGRVHDYLQHLTMQHTDNYSDIDNEVWLLAQSQGWISRFTTMFNAINAFDPDVHAEWQNWRYEPLNEWESDPVPEYTKPQSPTPAYDLVVPEPPLPPPFSPYVPPVPRDDRDSSGHPGDMNEASEEDSDHDEWQYVTGEDITNAFPTFERGE